MKRLFSIFFLICSCFLVAEEGEIQVLPEESYHEGDYVAVGAKVEVSGHVTGDVYAFAPQVIIDGFVGGDVVAAGGIIDVAGSVMGSARLFGGQVEINGTVAENASAVGGSIQLAPKASVGGNLIFTGGALSLSGGVGKDAILHGQSVRVHGDIGRNLEVTAGKIRVSSKAEIDGNFSYTSSEKASVSEGAIIRGETTYKLSSVSGVLKARWKDGFVVGSRITGHLMNLFYSFVTGCIIFRFFKKKYRGAMRVLQTRPWHAFWVGLLTAFLLPIACAVLLITILGFPFALALLAVGLLGFFAAKIFPVFWLSNRYLPRLGLKKEKMLTFFIGLCFFFLLAQVPIAGRILSATFTFLGIGSIVLRFSKKSKSQKSA